MKSKKSVCVDSTIKCKIIALKAHFQSLFDTKKLAQPQLAVFIHYTIISSSKTCFSHPTF